MRECLYCKELFEPKRKDKVYCTRVCKDRHKNSRRPSTATKVFGKSYKNADKLKAQSLTDQELQVIYGALLGDGTIVKTNHGYRFSFCHSEDQLPYLLWKKSLLPHLFLADPRRYERSYKGSHTVQYHLHSIHHPDLEQVYNTFYQDGTKTVTQHILSQLSPLSIAIWYMDDGSFNRNTNSMQIFWSTDSFTESEHRLIIDWFVQNHNIELKLQPMKNSGTFGSKPTWRIRINRKQVDPFFALISPYVHESMRYKIK